MVVYKAQIVPYFVYVTKGPGGSVS